MVLGMGNILNGGTPKGQDDGFDLSTLQKVAIVKDNTGNSMMSFICKKLYAEDNKFNQEMQDMLKNLSIKEIDLGYIKTKTQELMSMVAKAKGSLDEVLNCKEPHDLFIETM